MSERVLSTVLSCSTHLGVQLVTKCAHSSWAILSRCFLLLLTCALHSVVIVWYNDCAIRVLASGVHMCGRRCGFPGPFQSSIGLKEKGGE